MRRRILATYLTLIAGLLLALAIPLGWAFALERTNQLLLDRRADATRFALLAEQAVQDGDTSRLRIEIDRYADLYDATVQVRSNTGVVLTAAGTSLPASGEEAVHGAMLGRTTENLAMITPFGPVRAVIAEPVGRDAQVLGTVVLATPTTAARHAVAAVWLALTAAALFAFLLAAVAARRLARWMLRPVAELDAATAAITAGRLSARTSVTGPPELRQLEQRFNAMADAVTDALNRQRAFVSDASHELRTPLAVLSLRLENLRPHLTGSGATGYEQALEEMDRMTTLLDDLLALARIESGTVLAESVDLVGELGPRLRTWQEVATAAAITLRAELPSRLTARCPPDTAGRVADIAIDNALKFTEPGGRVTVSLTAAGRSARLSIADDGPGLPVDEIAVARQRFWRSTRHANVEGSGLGLAIADELATAAHGRLTLTAATPHGLVVTLELPLHEP
ncbi:sensor histidine kinase [Nocardia vaccinii]|uniref:sensor histidine kinase n=1 Tax=Nocardia vaccinii TaxID=1822 RepID=UPI00082C5829|nr:HAMP domain-containing sensor histidine kinase [Nocardia vaccinii]